MSYTYQNPIVNVEPDNNLWFYTSKYFDPSQENTLWFNSKASQWLWFRNHQINEMQTNNPTYAIKDEYSIDFRVPYTTEELYKCAYVCRVKDFGTVNEQRWYYFIDSVDAYSPNSSVIHCVLDVLQTFMFDWELGTQHILRTNGVVFTNLNTAINFTNEPDVPVLEECSSTTYIDPSVTDSVWGVSGHAFSTKCYLVVCTQFWTYDTDAGTGVFKTADVSGYEDPSELCYCVFLTLEKCLKFIGKFENTDKNKIKGVYGIPFICAFGGTRLDGVTETVVEDLKIRWTDGTILGYLRQTGARSIRYDLSVPLSIYSYTPKSPKTVMTNCLSLESRSGRSCMVKMTETEIVYIGGTPYIRLTIVGILSISPKVMVFPHIVPESGVLMSSNYLTFDINPSFTIYNSSDEEIYNRNYETSMATQSTSAIVGAILTALGVATAVASGGSTAPLVAGGAIVGGVGSMVTSGINIANKSATYQTPQNMIGNCESKDIWYSHMDYVVARWFSPVKQNLISFDNFLCTNGYNYAGELVNCNLNSDTHTGVNIFNRNCFNFLQIDNCKIKSDKVGIYKQRIENLFNKGIRFWNVLDTQVSSDGICNYTTALINRNES